jgi:hypothetical protein
MTSSLLSDVSAFEQKLGLPENFYTDLLKNDDWSFVVKLNALVEAACTHALSMRLHAPELEEALAHLDLANSKFGKATLLRGLNSITSEQAHIIRQLAELRNKLVHNVRNVTFSLPTYVNGLDKQQFSSFTKAFGHGLSDMVTFEGPGIPRDKFVKQAPRFSIWLTVSEVIACLYLELEVAKIRLQRLALAEMRDLTGQSNGSPSAAADLQL